MPAPASMRVILFRNSMSREQADHLLKEVLS